MKYITIESFFNFDSRGNSKLVKPGTILSQREYDKLSAPKKLKCKVYSTGNQRIRYTRDETQQIVDLYLQNDRPYHVAGQFRLMNPDSQHTDDSVTGVAYQLRALDINYPDYTEWSVKSLTEVVALETDDERFAPVSEQQSLILQKQAEAIIDELIN